MSTNCLMCLTYSRLQFIGMYAGGCAQYLSLIHIYGRLADVPVVFGKGAAACVVLASGGYPQKYATGKPISGLEEAEKTACVYHAGTKLEDGQIVTSGGRVLGVTATAETLAEAVDKAYAAAGCIAFEGAHMRRDIGRRALAALK